jgi:hypothetical protein
MAQDAAAELRCQAADLRRIAGQTLDAATRTFLLGLAETCEHDAAAAEATGARAAEADRPRPGPR